MKTLIIYDEVGYIISQTQGSPAPREPIWVPFMSVEIPEGKQIKYTDGIGVDISVTPNELILEDIPQTETELLNDKVTNLELLIDTLVGEQNE